MCGQVQIGFARFLRLFLKTMQHIDGVVELCHIQRSEYSRGIANSNFQHSSANRIHGFPVVRLAPVLDPVELISRLTPGRCRNANRLAHCLGIQRA